MWSGSMNFPKDLIGCIFSNEFFDALPVHRVVRRNGVLREIYLNEDFAEVEGDPQPGVDAPVDEGCLADISLDAREWVGRIAASLKCGFHLAIDYGYLEREFYARPRGTLMCYWRHQVSEDPYIRIGEQDITAHVNFSDLIEAGRAASLLKTEFSISDGFSDSPWNSRRNGIPGPFRHRGIDRTAAGHEETDSAWQHGRTVQSSGAAQILIGDNGISPPSTGDKPLTGLQPICSNLLALFRPLYLKLLSRGRRK